MFYDYSLPLFVTVDDEKYYIRNKCDYRTVLKVLKIYDDDELSEIGCLKCVLYNFYEHYYNFAHRFDDVSEGITNIEIGEKEVELLFRMKEIIDFNVRDVDKSKRHPKLVDWSYDFHNIAPAVSKVLTYDIRESDKYTHWFTFVGAMQEVGECYWTRILRYRAKKAHGEKMDKYDRDFYKNCKSDIDIPSFGKDNFFEWIKIQETKKT